MFFELQVVAPGPTETLVTFVTAFAATAGLGAAKKYTGIADTWVGSKIKPIQPWIVMGLSLVLPKILSGSPITIDPTALTMAPTATLLAVGCAEIYRRLVPAKPTL